MPTSRLKDRILSQCNELLPLAKKAKEAYKIHQEGWDSAYKEIGIAYKKAQAYEERLLEFHKKQKTINDIIIPAIENIGLKNNQSMDIVFAFLMMEQRYFRSGYLKSMALKKIKKVSLLDEEKEFLRDTIYEQVFSAGPEFNEWMNLWPIIKNKRIEETFFALRKHALPHVKRRAQRLLKKYYSGK